MSIIPEAAENFSVFLYLIWEEVFGFIPYEVQLKACDFLSQNNTHKLFMSMRGFGKSFIIATLTCWYLYRNPNCAVTIFSARERRAKDDLKLAQQIIMASKYLEHMRPKSENTWGAKECVIGSRNVPGKDPSIAAYGLGGGMTGSHADHIIGDDLEIPENSATYEAREKLLERIKEFDDLLNKGGTITLIGTPQSMDSVYFNLVSAEVYELYRIPSQYPDPSAGEDYFLGLPEWMLKNLLANKVKGGDPTFPERMPLSYLMKKLAKQGWSRYSLQMLCLPASADADKYPLKMKDCIVYDVGIDRGPKQIVHGTTDPRKDLVLLGVNGDRCYQPAYVSKDWVEYDTVAMYIDPAGGGTDGVGWAVGKVLNGMPVLAACGQLEGGHSEATLRKLVMIAQEHKVKRVGVEKNFGDGLYGKTLLATAMSMGYPIAIEHIHNTGNKYDRICDYLEPIVQSNKLIVNSKVFKDPEFVYQFTKVFRSKGCLKKDDIIEAVAEVINMLKDSLYVNTADKVKAKEDEAYYKEISELFKTNNTTIRNKPNKSFISKSKYYR